MKYAFCDTSMKEPEKNAKWKSTNDLKEALSWLIKPIRHQQAGSDSEGSFYEAYFASNGHVLVGDSGTFE